MTKTARFLIAAALVSLPMGQAHSETFVSGYSALGTYLAARQAQSLRDTTAANELLKSALERDPGNSSLLGQAFVTEVVGGDWTRAVNYARRASASDPGNQLARLVLGVDAFKSGRLADADKQFSQTGNTPLAVMARAWVVSARGDTKAALALLSDIKDANWIGFYAKYQSALLSDVAGDGPGAAKLFESLFRAEPGTINVALGYMRHASHFGDNKLAADIASQHSAAARTQHPMVEEARDEIAKGKALDLDVRSAADGLASVFYGFSQAINGQGGVDLAQIYAQLALQLRPNDPLATVQLAAIFEQLRQYDTAIDLYRKLPAGSPLQFDAKVRQGLNLNALDKTEEAKAALKAIAEPGTVDPAAAAKARSDLHAEIEAADGVAFRDKGGRVVKLQGWLAQLGYSGGGTDGNFGSGTRDALTKLQKDAGLQPTGQLGPQTRKAMEEKLAALTPPPARPLTVERQIDLYQTIGNMLRGRKLFSEAVDYYSKSIALVSKPERDNWDQFYSRAVCYERLGQWSKAEPDFRKALELSANEPLILNYLGYSWVDRNEHVAEALELIKKAVSLKPDDGYYIDSLGWAYFRLGRFDEAVEQLERAVELKPEDPTINDHLGDAYWRVGRKLEAQYQWSTSLVSKPEAADIPKLQAKMKDGLPADPNAPAPAASIQPAAPAKPVEAAKPVEPAKPAPAKDAPAKDKPKTP
jgi:tetratricopeptide (TPR) repeat protein